MKAPLPSDEHIRLAVLRQYDVLDASPEQALDDLTALAAHICGTPIALISFVGAQRTIVKSSVGAVPSETSREESFCAHVLLATAPVVVPDTTRDERFADNPLVTGETAIRFYAAAPLRSPEGQALGTICVLDRVPRALDDAQLRALAALSRQVMTQLELRRHARQLRENEEQLQLALDAAHMGTYTWDIARDLITCSREGAQIFGFAPGQFRATYAGFAERLHPYDLPLIDAELGRCMAERLPFEHEFRVMLPGGRVRWVLGRGDFVFDADGQPQRMRGVAYETTARKLAEAVLRENEERFHEAQRIAGIGSWRYLPDGTLIWSDQMYELFPLPRSVPPTFAALVSVLHPDDLHNGEHYAFEEALRSGSDYKAEYRVVWPDGRVRTMYSQGAIQRDADGGVLEVVGTVQDVTERKQAEQRIFKLNRLYAMLSGVNEAIVREPDPDPMLSTACRIAVQTGGFRLAAIAMAEPGGRLTLKAHWGADAATLAVMRLLIESASEPGCAFTARALRTGQHAICNDVAADPESAPWRGEALIRGYRSLASLPLTRGADVVGVFTIYAGDTGVFDEDEMQLLDRLASDISFALGAHQREMERQQAEERFRQVVENIQEVFWITDGARTKMLYVSPAYETIWGRSRESLYVQPRSWLEAVPAEDREQLAELAQAKLFTGDFHETFRITQPGGGTRWIRARAFPVPNAAGTIERIVGVATDITEQRELEDRFRQAQKMESMGRLAGGIAHDFNNLLTVINGTADLAALALRDGDPLRVDLREIRLAGDRAAALTRQLLALSRQQILKPAVINLSIVLRGMRDMLERLLGEDVRLVVRPSERLGSVKADPSQMEQVLLNLAVNARDAMPDGGTLTIETANAGSDGRTSADSPLVPTGSFIFVSVSDTGVGMDEAIRQRIFEPFFTTKALGKGTGLGLSTVYGIVQQSGGSIWVASEPGQGTTVTIALPRVDDVAPVEASDAPMPDAGGHETILLVEDEHALRGLTRRILESAGYTVLEAGHGTEAMARLDAYTDTVHLLLTDVVMPGMNGRELAGRVVTVRPETKVLYASGYTDDTILRHGVLDADSLFISKPYTPTDLKRRVREALDSLV